MRLQNSSVDFYCFFVLEQICFGMSKQKQTAVAVIKSTATPHENKVLMDYCLLRRIWASSASLLFAVCSIHIGVSWKNNSSHFVKCGNLQWKMSKPPPPPPHHNFSGRRHIQHIQHISSLLQIKWIKIRKWCISMGLIIRTPAIPAPLAAGTPRPQFAPPQPPHFRTAKTWSALLPAAAEYQQSVPTPYHIITSKLPWILSGTEQRMHDTKLRGMLPNMLFTLRTESGAALMRSWIIPSVTFLLSHASEVEFAHIHQQQEKNLGDIE